MRGKVIPAANAGFSPPMHDSPLIIISPYPSPPSPTLCIPLLTSAVPTVCDVCPSAVPAPAGALLWAQSAQS